MGSGSGSGSANGMEKMTGDSSEASLRFCGFSAGADQTGLACLGLGGWLIG